MYAYFNVIHDPFSYPPLFLNPYSTDRYHIIPQPLWNPVYHSIMGCALLPLVVFTARTSHWSPTCGCEEVEPSLWHELHKRDILPSVYSLRAFVRELCTAPSPHRMSLWSLEGNSGWRRQHTLPSARAGQQRPLESPSCHHCKVSSGWWCSFHEQYNREHVSDWEVLWVCWANLFWGVGWG